MSFRRAYLLWRHTTTSPGGEFTGNADRPATGYISTNAALCKQETENDSQTSTSQAEVGEVHDYNYPDVNHYKTSAPMDKGNSESRDNNVTQEIPLCHTYHSGSTSVNEHDGLRETDFTDADGYLVPNIIQSLKQGSFIAEDNDDYHSYNYPDPVVEHVPIKD